ncbi:hypothetical protein PIB30_020695 [Stylosanthes scabra]|uniref:Uncharacterized protein n=1 Tax=Stylosanthes scabra TaxID=79078 RepID=A0ABU6X6V1_9FABA|nr:hypothetical protein [Stylosanthes scabra]
MALVRGFGAFESLSDYNLKQHMLKQLVNIFDIRDNIIHSVHGEVEITTQNIGKALGLSWNGNPFDTKVDEKTLSEEDLAVFKMFQGKHQADLTRLVLRTPVDTEANRILFKRYYAHPIFIKKCFLLATSSPNGEKLALHMHDFLLGEVKKAKQNNTKAIHGCCYVLMIIYFHETHFGKNPREPEAQLPWITYWTGENLRKRLHREQNHATISIFPGLVQTDRLRTGKERLERRNKELEMGVIRRKDTESSESESAESDSEEGYDSEKGSNESSSSGSSPDIDSENTMSEEMVQRRPLANTSPALQERRSKQRQEEPIDSR